MRARPLVLLGTVATFLVTWFVIRMWVPEASGVWQVSCALGAWAPLGAAVIFRYIQLFGDREDGVLAAWLVRAIGMHCVLVWLIGISDWLRGPPGTPAAWNADAGMPLVFLAFFPAFGLSLALVRWLDAVAARLGDDTPVIARSHVITSGGTPYRDASPRTEEVPVRAPALAWAALLAVGLVAAGVSFSVSPSPLAVVGASAVALSLASNVGRRAVLPSVLALVAVTGVVLFRDADATFSLTLPRMMTWPCLVAAALGVYLAPLEIQFRLQRLDASR